MIGSTCHNVVNPYSHQDKGAHGKSGEGVHNDSLWSFIGGGNENKITSEAHWSVIGGGYKNVLTADYANIAGGVLNVARSNFVSIAGLFITALATTVIQTLLHNKVDSRIGRLVVLQLFLGDLKIPPQAVGVLSQEGWQNQVILYFSVNS